MSLTLLPPFVAEAGRRGGGITLQKKKRASHDLGNLIITQRTKLYSSLLHDEKVPNILVIQADVTHCMYFIP